MPTFLLISHVRASRVREHSREDIIECEIKDLVRSIRDCQKKHEDAVMKQQGERTFNKNSELEDNWAESVTIQVVQLVP